MCPSMTVVTARAELFLLDELYREGPLGGGCGRMKGASSSE